MGQQIAMVLSIANKQKLVDHLVMKFPHTRVVNEVYPWGLGPTDVGSSWRCGRLGDY